ncbi:dipeptide transporter; membrane component of ABC superfamily [Frankia canadensis]|uniref:Dipeptide transporter membrane component of ABC superfamily n=1 Tax=Frankia canadensis TaxID=1836972 RepID=A0A2I2KKX3_9ACTN|nr:ABC transporter permease [Frankia canadensis]SNQ46319.1 dipeptide transporter; membrane component of ABC superfamily [Frankia canadensis]SOU53609.1 dipeptide transporter; membrane component of ABC superfamily [Frankia canadensis]
MRTVDASPRVLAVRAAGARRRLADVPVPVLVAAVVLAVAVVVVLAPGLVAGSPTRTDPVQALRGPSWKHLFGTDQLGRDTFSRVAYGARPSLLLGCGATAVSVAGGVLLGLAAGFSGRVGDQVLMRVTDMVLALPPLLVALVVIAVLGSGTVNVLVAIGVAFVPPYARMVRAEVMLVRRSGYVEAAVGLGLRRRVLVVRHVLPNALGPLLVLATVGFGTSLIYASSLSFLGLGTRPPAPEWGAMLSESRDFLSSAWWIGLFPGLAVTTAVVAINVVGRHLQATFTGRTRR